MVLHTRHYLIILYAVFAIIFYKCYAVKNQFIQENRHILALLKDLEIKMTNANKYMERRVLDKSIDTQDERLEQSEQILKHRVAAVVEESLLLKIKSLHANPISESKTTQLSEQEHDLETLARAKEFVYNYNMLNDIPKEVRRWYTYISTEVDYLSNLGQKDQRLINYIRRQLLIPPAPENSSSAMTNDELADMSNEGPLQSILEIFKNKKNGVFLECGASDGDNSSTTLVLERNFGWRGALIEADPSCFKNALNIYRKSWLVPTCLSLGAFPRLVHYAKNTNGLWRVEDELETTNEKSAAKHLIIHCMPLTAIIFSLDMANIDFLSLYVRGDEFEILRNIDFQRININVLLLDISQSGVSTTTFERFLEAYGYSIFPSNAEWATKKLIFIKESSGL